MEERGGKRGVDSVGWGVVGGVIPGGVLKKKSSVMFMSRVEVLLLVVLVVLVRLGG